MPGLDVLRGIAILMVLLFHGLGIYRYLFDSVGNLPMHCLGELLYQSYHGVHLFFVLSGFLITGILWDSRADTDYFLNFYTRRLLRLAPAYLLMLAVLLALHTITWRYLAVALLCLCNMPGLLGVAPQYGPLWSLSVEEQFYLVWPFAIRHLSHKRIVQLCLAVILLTPLLRLALLYGPVALHDIEFKTWVLCDFFAAGALLALVYRSPQWHAKLKAATISLLLAGAILFVLLRTGLQGSSPGMTRLRLALDLEPWLLLFTGLLLFAILRASTISSHAAKPLIFLAKISYGLYLCHQLLFDLVDKHWPLLPNTTHPLAWLTLRFVTESVLAIAIATVSRYTLEAFFLRMKPGHTTAVHPVGVAPYNEFSRGN
jgi:peptidoglycan/LPS O-acetylase OafA/YrhL